MRHRAEEGGPLGVEKLVTYLETTAPGDLRPAAPVPGLEVVRVAGRTPTECARIRRLHDAVATPHLWSSLSRSEDGWQAVMDDPARSHWVATVDGRDVGWASLSHTGEHEVEIVSFGLRPDGVGRGYGGDFLTRIVREAWEFAGVAPAHATSPLAGRVWLHTSSWDHPHALANYRSRGFVVGRLELQDQQPGRRERRTRPVDAPPPFLVRPAVPDDATAVRGLLDALGYPCDTAVVRSGSDGPPPPPTTSSRSRWTRRRRWSGSWVRTSFRCSPRPIPASCASPPSAWRRPWPATASAAG
jgi:GNAT superfamily N-acetyltransferase